MKLKLTELTEKITALPWTPFGIDGKHGLDCNGQLPVVCHVVDQYRGEHMSNKVYLAHSANVLPKLVEALNDCVESLSRLEDKDDAYRVTCLQQAQKALTLAREVEI